MKEKPVIINIPSVDTWNLTSLRYACKKNKVKGYKKMTRDQLIEEVKGIVARLPRKGDE